MKKVLSVLACSAIIATHSMASEFQSPHTFEPGQVLTADVLNELFEYIEQTNKEITMADILGNWQCKKIVAGDMYPTMVSDHYTTVDADALWHYVDVPVTFIDDGDGSFSWSSTGINAFSIGGAEPRDVCDGAGNVSLFHRSFAISYTQCDNAWSGLYEYKITMYSATNMEIRQMLDNINQARLVCDKLDVPPAIPGDVSAVVDAGNATLSWTDTSDDETGFVILRKDSLEGQYQEIGSLAAVNGTGSTLNYSDNGLPTGTYWYRVQSENIHGRSLGSIVVSIDI